MLRRETSQVSTLERFAEPAVARQRQVHLLDEAKDELVDRYRRGALQRELADAYGIERRTVSAIIAGRGARRRRGLDEHGVDEAVNRYESGQSLAEVGRALGVDHGTVRNRLLDRGTAMRDTHGRAH